MVRDEAIVSEPSEARLDDGRWDVLHTAEATTQAIEAAIIDVILLEASVEAELEPLPEKQQIYRSGWSSYLELDNQIKKVHQYLPSGDGSRNFVIPSKKKKTTGDELSAVANEDTAERAVPSSADKIASTVIQTNNDDSSPKSLPPKEISDTDGVTNEKPKSPTAVAVQEETDNLLYKNTKVTIRVLDGPSETFYRVKRTDALNRVARAHAARKGVKAVTLELNDQPINLRSSPSDLNLPDLVALSCRVGRPIQKNRKSFFRRDTPTGRVIHCKVQDKCDKEIPVNSVNGKDMLVISIKSASLTDDDAFYYTLKNDPLQIIFEAHAQRTKLPLAALDFYSANGEKVLKPADTPAQLHFADLTSILCLPATASTSKSKQSEASRNAISISNFSNSEAKNDSKQKQHPEVPDTCSTPQQQEDWQVHDPSATGNTKSLY